MLRSMMQQTPTRTRSDRPFLTLRQEMDRLFDHWMTDIGEETGRLGMTEEAWFTPKVDVLQTEEMCTVRAELPGIDKKNLHVRVVGDHLVISGEKKATTEEKTGDFFRKERFFGSFRREIPLPVQVAEAHVEATYDNGVLNVKLPKTPEARRATKEITIA